jgi:Alpha-tubulin suppressor and related RCC1 domain-containing proteins
VTTADVAYCWGANDFGQIGRSAGSGSAAPVEVAGGLHFRKVEAGGWHTCGIGTDDRAYCWGRNTAGQVGDRSESEYRDAPVRVAGGRLYRELGTGSSHTCAVTTGHLAFCWGDGRLGQLGNGKRYLSFWPRRVAGALTLQRVTAGVSHTCGETTDNRAYCWGSNDQGQVGDGKGAGNRLTPSPVAGGLFFSQVSAGGVHTCGRTPAGVAYCWGWNPYGQLGDGTTTDRPKPTRVVGP